MFYASVRSWEFVQYGRDVGSFDSGRLGTHQENALRIVRAVYFHLALAVESYGTQTNVMPDTERARYLP